MDRQILTEHSVYADLMNKTKIYNEETMLNAIFKRPAGTPLITYCNHESCMDDPMLLCKFSVLISYFPDGDNCAKS